MRNGEVRTITSDTEEKNLQEMFESDGYYKIIANGNFQLWHVQSVYGKLMSSVGKRKTKFVAQSTHRYADLRDQAKTIHLEMIPKRFRSKGFETLANVNGAGHDIPTIDSSDVNICSEGPTNEMTKQPTKDECDQSTCNAKQVNELELTAEKHKEAQHTSALQPQPAQPQLQQTQAHQANELELRAEKHKEAQHTSALHPQPAQPQLQQTQAHQANELELTAEKHKEAQHTSALQPQQPLQPLQQPQPQQPQQQVQDQQLHEPVQPDQQAQPASDEPSATKATNEIPDAAAKATEAYAPISEQGETEANAKMHTECEEAYLMKVSSPQNPCSQNKMNKSEEITSILGAISQMQDTDTCTPQNEFKQNEFKQNEFKQNEFKQNELNQIAQPHNAEIQFEDAANDIGSVDQSRFAELESEVKDVREKFNALSVYPEYMRNIMSDFDSKQQAEQKFRLSIVEQITSIGNVFTKMENTIFNQLDHMHSRLSALQSCAHSITVQRKSNYLLLYILQNSQEACDCIANLYFLPSFDIF